MFGNFLLGCSSVAYCWSTYIITDLLQMRTHYLEIFPIQAYYSITEADVLKFEGRAYAQVGDVDSFWR